MKTKSSLSRAHSMLVEAKRVVDALNKVLKQAGTTMQAIILIILLTSSAVKQIHAEWTKPLEAVASIASAQSRFEASWH